MKPLLWPSKDYLILFLRLQILEVLALLDGCESTAAASAGMSIGKLRSMTLSDDV